MSSTLWRARRRGERPVIYGRDRERAQLRELLDDAIAGHGSLVLISGEAGIGKTTLVDDLVVEAVQRNCLVLTGGCYDLTSTPPYGPWAEVIGGYDPPEGSAPFPGWFANPEALEQMGSQAQLFEEARRFFADVADDQPLVIVLEDLHWSDNASLDAVRFLSRQLSNDPWLIVATYRDDEITRRHQLFQLLPTLVRESEASRIELRRWNEQDTWQLISARYRLDTSDQSRLSTYVHDLSEGNPFFAGELLRSLESENLLKLDRDHWQLEDLARLQIPPLVQQLIEGRLTQLDDASQSALEVAAIIGHEFAFDLWSSVLDAEEPALLDVLDQAIEANLAKEVSSGGFHFTHALVRETLYERVVWVRRRQWHQRAGEILAESTGSDPDAIAYHFQQAHDARAVDWLIRAADRAEQSIALASANERLEAALKLVADDPERENDRGWLLLRIARNLSFIDPSIGLAHLREAEHIALNTNDSVLKSQSQSLRGQHLINTGHLRAGLDEMSLGLAELNIRTDSHHSVVTRYDWRPQWIFISWLANVGRFQQVLKEGEALLEDPAPDVRVVAQGVGRAYSAFGRPEEALAAFDASLKAGAHINWPIIEVSTGISLLDTRLAYRTDEVDILHYLADELSRSYQRVEGAYRTYLTEELIGNIGHTVLMMTRGRWDEAEAMFHAHHLSPAVFGRHRAAGHLAALALHRGYLHQAQKLVYEVLSDGPLTTPGDCIFTSGLELQRTASTLALRNRDLEQSHSWLAAYDRWMEWSGAVLGLSEGQLGKAHYHRVAGNPSKSREYAKRAFQHASNPRQPLALIAADRFLGQLDVDEGKHEDAEVRLDASLKLAEKCEAPFEEALTLVVMAERAAKLGEVDEARQFISRVREICEPLEAKPTLERIDEIEAMLPKVRRSTEEQPYGLTMREVEVLRLVARGRTDAEAAEELFISPRTVSQHLRNIYNKLSVNNRAEATRVAVEAGIT